jgi:peptidyl-prolyl cis-trans isomerase B (cyclophilin B)
VATNQMRREAAKRKLARQQERRAQQARRRRQVAVITAVAVVVVVVVGVVVFSTIGRGSSAPADAAAPAAPTPLPAEVSCSYPSEGDAAKPNQPPKTDGITTQGTAHVALTTSAGPIGLTLDPSKAPCAVNSFLSLASQKYFDGTPCHRLTTGEGLKVLQCGDPSGSGQGGPGYTITDEPPTGLAPASGGAVVYPRGTLAMAKTSAPNSGGSQFFLVYADSTLPPEYTVFGTIDDPGLATLDAIANGGSDNSNGQGDGKPTTPVTIQTAAVG